MQSQSNKSCNTILYTNLCPVRSAPMFCHDILISCPVSLMGDQFVERPGERTK